MSEGTTIIGNAGFAGRRLCPACDYDLRGNISGRCPECGTVVGAGPISNVPWVHRARRGERRAYFETLWMVITHPRRLAQEAGRRIQIVHARRFHRESIALATVLTTGALTIAFLARGPTIEMLFTPASGRLFPAVAGIPESPVTVLSDSMLFLLPLTLAVFVSLHVSMALYRMIFALGVSRTGAAGRVRRRAEVLAYYGSGLTPVLGLMLGSTLALWVTRVDMTYPPTWLLRVGVPTGLIFLPLAALWTFYFPTLVLLRRAGRAGAMRMFVMAYLYPLVQPVVWLGVAIGVFWLVGYAAIAVWSTVH